MIENIVKGILIIVVLVFGKIIYEKIKPNNKLQLCGKEMNKYHLSKNNEKNEECLPLGNTHGFTIDNNSIIPSIKE